MNSYNDNWMIKGTKPIDKKITITKSKTTIVIGYECYLIAFLIKGRLTAKEVNNIYRDKGWGYERYKKTDIKYEFIRRTHGGFKKSDINDLKAEIYTIVFR